MLPNLIIIGAMKCGSTSLRFYLDQHPAIAMAPGGLNFFLAEQNWTRGRTWYEDQFTGPAAIHGDTSPRYANFPAHRDVAERMAVLVPDARLIYLVRDPIERLVSHYLHNLAHGAEARSLPEALRDPVSSEYVWRSRYFAQLERFLPHYRESLLVVFHEDLRDQRSATLRHIFAFLGVDAEFKSDAFNTVRHRTAAKFAHPVARPEVPADIRGALRAIFRPDLERLSALTGRDLSAWCT